MDPTAKLSSIQEEQKSDYSVLDEDQYQNMNEVKEIQLEEEDPMNNIAPSTPTGQGGASKQMPTSRSSHPTRDLYRTDKDRSKTKVCFKRDFSSSCFSS